MFKRKSQIKQALSDAQSRLDRASLALQARHKGGEWDTYRQANAEVLHLERELAASKGEPYAISADFPVKWDVGAPLPYLLCNDYKTFLTFFVDEPPDPNWDGSTVKVVDPSNDESMSLCLVIFKGCVSAKLGHPNDEAQHGHPLYGRGQDGYTAQIVMNSPWITEVAQTNGAHQHDRPERWERLNHYIFWFHDTTFECLADGYEVELTNESMSELLTRVQQRLLG